MMQQGTDTWLAACRQVAEAWSACGRAQADICCNMARSWADGLPDPRTLLRDELIVACSEAERFADAAGETLKTLQPTDGPRP
jgi:hypothetical protein